MICYTFLGISLKKWCISLRNNSGNCACANRNSENLFGVTFYILMYNLRSFAIFAHHKFIGAVVHYFHPASSLLFLEFVKWRKQQSVPWRNWTTSKTVNVTKKSDLFFSVHKNWNADKVTILLLLMLCHGRVALLWHYNKKLVV